MDDSELFSLSTADFGVETRGRALEAYERRDWYGVYAWTKAWISDGGGAWVIDSWLLYVVSDLLHGRPKGAVHATDMTLDTWIEAPQDRAVLLWVRAYIIDHRLRDPKTAIEDYEAAARHAPLGCWSASTTTGPRPHRRGCGARHVGCVGDALRQGVAEEALVPVPATFCRWSETAAGKAHADLGALGRQGPLDGALF